MIGQTITITKAQNKQLEGTTGKIIDETKHTIIIQTPTKQKTIIKEQIEETQ